MQNRRCLVLMLIFALLMAGLPTTSHAGGGTGPVAALGAGAELLPAGTAAYVAVDLQPDPAQTAQIDRLVAYAAGLADARGGAASPVRAAYGSSADLLSDVQPWIGHELFVALPRSDDLPRLLMGAGAREGSPTGLLVGAAIADREGFNAFLVELGAQLYAGGTRVESDSYRGVEIIRVSERAPEGSTLYLAVYRGYALLSDDRGLLVQALEQDPAGSLAATASFREALVRLGPGALGFLFANATTPPALTPDSAVGAIAGVSARAFSTPWLAGALRLEAEGVRIDTLSAVDPTRLTPAARELREQGPNPLRGATAVPADSLFFAGLDHLDLVIDAALASVLTDPAEFERFRAQARDTYGFDPRDDLYGWMTGEGAIFVSPGSGEAGPGSSPSLGLVIEAKEPALAAEKLGALVNLVDRQAQPGREPGLEEVSGFEFYRLPLSNSEALYAGVVGEWLVLASTPAAAAGSVAAITGGGGLAETPAFQAMRSALPGPQTSFLFLDVPGLVRAMGLEAGTSPALEAVQGVGLRVRDSRDRSEATLFVRMAIPDPVEVAALALPAGDWSSGLAALRAPLDSLAGFAESFWAAGSTDAADS